MLIAIPGYMLVFSCMGSHQDLLRDTWQWFFAIIMSNMGLAVTIKEEDYFILAAMPTLVLTLPTACCASSSLFQGLPTTSQPHTQLNSCSHKQLLLPRIKHNSPWKFLILLMKYSCICSFNGGIKRCRCYTVWDSVSSGLQEAATWVEERLPVLVLGSPCRYLAVRARGPVSRWVVLN